MLKLFGGPSFPVDVGMRCLKREQCTAKSRPSLDRTKYCKNAKHIKCDNPKLVKQHKKSQNRNAKIANSTFNKQGEITN